MSYLTTPDLPEFSKAVISFWFQVPQAALDAAQAELDQDLRRRGPTTTLGAGAASCFWEGGDRQQQGRIGELMLHRTRKFIVCIRALRSTLLVAAVGLQFA